MAQYIGIDIGGTNIRIGAIDKNDEIIFQHKKPTFKEGIKDSVVLYEDIKQLIKMVPNYKNVKAIGIGFPGSVDTKIGRIITSRNVSIFNDFPLVQNLEREFGKSVFIENDARVATFAEAIKGVGKDKEVVCYITISTGLGGGVVINKSIYHGSNNLGAYFAEMILDGRNISDSLISGTALLKQAKNGLGDNIVSTIELFDLEEQGNLIAKEIIEKFKKNLTVLLLNISSIINPDIIILGGGVLKSKDRFLLDVINRFRINAHPLARNTEIETTMFEEPGIMGASLMAKSLHLNID